MVMFFTEVRLAGTPGRAREAPVADERRVAGERELD